MTSIEAVAAGLCPPPEAVRGIERTGTVSCLANDVLHRRRARFIPLVAPGEELATGLLVLVEPQDLSADEPAVPPPEVPKESEELHERIRQFRQQLAGRFREDWLLGTSTAIARAWAQASLAAASRVSVLLVGSPGCGKQHLASVIHYSRPPETTGTLIPLACDVLGEELILSTLSALARRNVPSGAADRSTLLLADADQIPPESQALAAKWLASKTFSARVIATAREPLVPLASQGKYDEELASLLSTLVIELPPLAQRREDLPLLAQEFVERLNARGGKQLAGFSSDAMDCLDAYGWPGNIDELFSVVEQSHERAEGPRITLRDLPAQLHLSTHAASHPRRQEETIVLDDFLGRVERELIGRALARSKGNKTKAARLLGMTRPRLYRRLVQLGLAAPEEEKS